MVLPIESDIERAIAERPNDQIYAKIKHHVLYAQEKSDEIKAKIMDILVDDLVVGHALASALDDLGKVIEYHAQNNGIERPRFDGESVMRDFERVSHIASVLRIADALGLTDNETEMVVRAEIGRQWREPTEERENPDVSPTLKLPDDVSNVLREIAKALGRKKDDGSPANGKRGHSKNGRGMAQADGRNAGGVRGKNGGTQT